MKYLVAATALFATPAFAHSGHTAVVDGHSHTLVDLMIMGAAPAFIIVLLTVGALVWLKRRND